MQLSFKVFNIFFSTKYQKRIKSPDFLAPFFFADIAFSYLLRSMTLLFLELKPRAVHARSATFHINLIFMVRSLTFFSSLRKRRHLI